MVVEVKKVVQIYRSHKESFDTNDLEKVTREIQNLGGNVKVTSRITDDGEELIFEVG